MPSTFSLLGTIKCSTCGADVDIAELGDHVCAAQKPKPAESVLPSLASPSKPDSAPTEPSRQSKPNLRPIDSEAANRPFLGPREELVTDSSSLGSQESPATPADGQPLTTPLASARARNQSDSTKSPRPNKEQSNLQLKPVEESPRGPSIKEQHLYAPLQDPSLYAPFSPTMNSSKNLLAKLNTIAPGPFGVGSSHQRTLSKPNTIDSGLTQAEDIWSSKRELSAKARRESSERARIREDAERKLIGIRDSAYSRESSTSTANRRPLTSGSDRRPTTSGSEKLSKTSSSISERRPPTAGSFRSTGSKRSLSIDSSGSSRKQDQIPLGPKERKPSSKQTEPAQSLVETSKPTLSPSYQAYRPTQPVQRLPPSPRLMEFKYRGPVPSGNEHRPQTPVRPRAGLPMHAKELFTEVGPHSRQPSNVSLHPFPREPSPGPPTERAFIKGSQMRKASNTYQDHERVGRRGPPPRGLGQSPDSDSMTRDRSLSPAPSKDKIIQRPVRRPSREDTLTHPNSLLPASQGSKRSDSNTAIAEASRRKKSASGHSKLSPSKGSIDLKEIDGLMKDIQSSIKDLGKASPVNENFKDASSQKREAPSKRVAAKSNCRGCGEAIQGKGLTSSDGRLTGRYHKQCFVCQACKEPFSSSTFYVWDDLPYCARHYHELNNSLCKSCDKGIEGPCLETERKERFHPQCFTCKECRTVLGEDYFELNGKPYCERHAHKRMQMNARLGSGRNIANMERRRTRFMMM